MTSSRFSGPRAGFWRRMSALAFDCFLVGMVISVVGPLTFSVTGGRVQVGGVGIATISCTGISTVSASLDPPPPQGSNHAEVCKAGALPFAMSEYFLRVGRKTASPGITEDVSQVYALSSAGYPIAAIDLTWLAQLGFLAYFGICLVYRGRTLGMRLLRLRLLVPPADTASVGVSPKRLLIRVGVALGGFAPSVLALVLALVFHNSGAAGPLIVAAVLLALLWAGYNLILVACKEDPVYDRVPGSAVLVEGA